MKVQRFQSLLAVTFGLVALLGAGCSNRPSEQRANSSETTEENEVRTVPRNEVLTYAEAENAPLLLDVRTEAEFIEGHVPGAINIPHTALADHLDELDAYQEQGIVVYCRSGRRAGIALDVLARAGFTNLGHLEGDMEAWNAEGLPVE